LVLLPLLLPLAQLPSAMSAVKAVLLGMAPTPVSAPLAPAHARCRRPALQRHLLADITGLVVPALRPVRSVRMLAAFTVPVPVSVSVIAVRVPLGRGPSVPKAMLAAVARLASVMLGHPTEEEAQPVAGSLAPLTSALPLPLLLPIRAVKAAKRTVVARVVVAKVALLLLLVLLLRTAYHRARRSILRGLLERSAVSLPPRLRLMPVLVMPVLGKLRVVVVGVLARPGLAIRARLPSERLAALKALATLPSA
jgi:hypothetical protein